MTIGSETEIHAAFDQLLGADTHAKLRLSTKGIPAFGLTEAERLAIWVYSTGANGQYYRAFNSTDADKPFMALLKLVLIAALEKRPTFRGRVYRGIKVDNIEQFCGGPYAEGMDVTWSRFTSASRRADRAFPGNVYFRIKSNTGRVLGKLSSFPQEEEVLFVPQTRFKVLKFWQSTQVVPSVVLDLEEL